jgi:hypothetical protein
LEFLHISGTKIGKRSCAATSACIMEITIVLTADALEIVGTILDDVAEARYVAF